jgi:hypothetical protein
MTIVTRTPQQYVRVCVTCGGGLDIREPHVRIPLRRNAGNHYRHVSDAECQAALNPVYPGCGDPVYQVDGPDYPAGDTARHMREGGTY